MTVDINEEWLMATFLDGPAKGVTLFLQQTPKYLRVVQAQGTGHSKHHYWDALDKVTDTANSSETLYVYIYVRGKGGAFVDGHDPKTGRRYGFFSANAEYKHVVLPSVLVETFRDNAVWKKWANAPEQNK